MTTPDGDRPEDAPAAGSVGEEAAKLFGAFSEWARDHEQAGPTGGPGTHGDDCRYCPVCQLIHVVRETSPEVRDHLGAAAGSLLQAAASLMATHAPSPRTRPGGVERIDLEDDDEAPRG